MTGVQTCALPIYELLFDPENLKAYNLDNVIAQFRDARKCILGGEISFDDL